MAPQGCHGAVSGRHSRGHGAARAAPLSRLRRARPSPVPGPGGTRGACGAARAGGACERQRGAERPPGPGAGVAAAQQPQGGGRGGAEQRVPPAAVHRAHRPPARHPGELRCPGPAEAPGRPQGEGEGGSRRGSSWFPGRLPVPIPVPVPLGSRRGATPSRRSGPEERRPRRALVLAGSRGVTGWELSGASGTTGKACLSLEGCSHASPSGKGEMSLPGLSNRLLVKRVKAVLLRLPRWWNRRPWRHFRKGWTWISVPWSIDMVVFSLRVHS